MTAASSSSSDTRAVMASLLPSFRATLRAFTTSNASYQLFRSTTLTPASAAKKLFILDSSFNPPTKAHFLIARSAFQDSTTGPLTEKRLLLLLAINNADKAPKPASFEERIAMMSLFSSEISTAASVAADPAAVDVAVTKHARFLDKARELETHYEGVDEFVFLTGFDTLVRIFDTKYYPEDGHRLDRLDAFFERGVVWCMFRTGDGYGSRKEQEAWLERLRGGELESVGGRREWAGRVMFIENDLGEVISSTRVREAVKVGDKEVLGVLLTEGVRDWVLERGLYCTD